MRDIVLRMLENRCRVIFICIFISLWTLGESFDAKAFDDTVLFKLNWPGKENYDIMVRILKYPETIFSSYVLISSPIFSSTTWTPMNPWS
jgi:hypothetical protein